MKKGWVVSSTARTVLRLVACARAHGTALETCGEARAEAVPTAIGLTSLRSAVDLGEPRARREPEVTALLHERACERRNDRVLGVGRDLGMRGAGDAPRRLGVLEQGVLESAARPEERSSALAREANRGERAGGVGVRARRHAPERIVGRENRFPHSGRGSRCASTSRSGRAPPPTWRVRARAGSPCVPEPRRRSHR